MRRVDQIALEIATETLSPGRRIDDAAWAVARIKRLETALKAAKRDHRFKLRPFFNAHEVCPADDSEDACVARERFHGRSGSCSESCGADAHNAAIDAALGGEEPRHAA